VSSPQALLRVNYKHGNIGALLRASMLFAINLLSLLEGFTARGCQQILSDIFGGKHGVYFIPCGLGLRGYYRNLFAHKPVYKGDFPAFGAPRIAAKPLLMLYLCFQ
jgi:hypothetical protein